MPDPSPPPPDATLRLAPGGGVPRTQDRPPEVDRAAAADQVTVVPPSGSFVGAVRPVVVPGYHIVREIARGGMGRVLAARDLGLDRHVALKVLLPGFPPGGAARFVREAKITARLSHPAIPPVHALGTLPDGTPFLAMKLVEGSTLAERLGRRRSRAADLPESLRIFEQVCQAVGYAHAHGVVHRDLKPSNVMVGAFGEVQVMDWGLAKEIGEPSARRAAPARPPAGADTPLPAAAAETAEHPLLAVHPAAARAGSRVAPLDDTATFAGQVLGTPAYMAPEQARGDVLTERADVFGLGGILCDILTDRPPFLGGSAPDKLERAAAGELADAHAALDGCGADPDLIDLCKRCLAADPAARPGNGRAVADAVAAYRLGVEDRLRRAETERVAAAAREAELRKRRRAQLALLALVAGFAVVAAAFAGLHARRQAEQRARDAGLAAELERADADRRAAAAERDRAAAEQRANGAELAAELERARREQGERDARDRAERDRRDRAERDRLAANAAAVTRLLDEADDALGADDVRRAAVALEQAEKRAADGGAAALAGRVARARADLRLLRDLTHVHDTSFFVSRNHRPDAAEAGLLAAAFARYGVVPGVTDAAEAARLAAASRVRDRLLTGLDLWLFRLPADRRAPLAAVLRAVAPDPYRDAVRAAAADPDWVNAVHRLVMRPEVMRQPARFAVVLGLVPNVALDRRVAVLRTASVRAPSDPVVLMTLAALVPHQPGVPEDARRAEAAGCYRAAIAVRPRNAAAWDAYGIALQEQGRGDEAVEAFTRAVELDPGNYRHLSNRGVAHMTRRDYAAAEAEFRAVIRAVPAFDHPRWMLAKARRNVGDRAGARAVLEEALAVCPASADLHREYAEVLLEAREVDPAIAELRAAVRLAPEHPELRNTLGAVLMNERKRAAEAEGQFREAIRLRPDYAQAYYNLGVVLRAQNDRDGWERAWRTAAGLEPGRYARFADQIPPRPAPPVAPPPREVPGPPGGPAPGR